MRALLVVVLVVIMSPLSGSGQIFVSNSGSGSIGEYSLSGEVINSALITGLNDPTGIALDNNGHIFVVNQGNDTLGEYTTSGATINASLISGLHEDWCCGGVAVDGDGHIFVANYNYNGLGEGGGIAEYTISGALITSNLIPGLMWPNAVALDGSGHMFIGTYQHGVGEWTTAGEPINPTLLSVPSAMGVALDGAGNLFVVDWQDGTIGEYTTSGATVNATLVSGLSPFYGVALDGEGHLFTADYGGGAIGEYTTSGVAVTASFITGLNSPYGLAIEVPEPSSEELLALGLVIVSGGFLILDRVLKRSRSRGRRVKQGN